jgi:hypothetical protein
MARKTSHDDEVRETNRRMTPSERQAEDVPGPDRKQAENLHMPRPGTGALLSGEKRPRDRSETARAARRAAERARRKE